jgi:hypothetical protein
MGPLSLHTKTNVACRESGSTGPAAGEFGAAQDYLLCELQLSFLPYLLRLFFSSPIRFLVFRAHTRIPSPRLRHPRTLQHTVDKSPPELSATDIP